MRVQYFTSQTYSQILLLYVHVIFKHFLHRFIIEYAQLIRFMNIKEKPKIVC